MKYIKVYLNDKTNSDKAVHNLQLTQARIKSFHFKLFYTMKEIFLVFMQFFQAPYTEPVPLIMKFPTRG